MIPYDDLVVALATWRAKQGLPVGQLSGALAPPPVQAAPTPAKTSGSGPKKAPPPAAAPARPAPGPAPGSGRTAAPAPRSGRTTAPPPQLQTVDDLDVDEAMVDEHLEPEGDDFNSAFGTLQADGDESTSIGTAPARDSFGGATTQDLPKGAARAPNRNDDW